METVIQVEHLRKRYGDVVAVSDVSFSVFRGEIFGLLGRNGAGKTTTVECLQGLRRADGGRMLVLGLDPDREARLLRLRIGCQLQESGLPDRLRVWEALDLFSRDASGLGSWRDTLEDWGLSEKRRASFGSLSGGQRQRLLVALALVNRPEVVFLDEMTTGLDPAARRLTWDLIRRIRDRGTTVVLVTHFMDEAEALCDRIGIIDRGRVAALDSPQRLVARQTSAVRVLFSTELPDLSFLQGVEGVAHLVRRGSRVEIEGRGAVLARVAAALVQRGVAPEDLRVEQPTLEDVFLSITQGRDKGGST